MSQMIEDGYTFPFTLPAVGPFEAITGMYRVALPEQVYEFRAANQSPGFTAKRQMEATFKLLLGHGKNPIPHLRSWDAKAKKPGETEEKDVPISEEGLRTLLTSRLDKLVDYVCGYTFDQQEEDVKN